jgi:endoglucanase
MVPLLVSFGCSRSPSQATAAGEANRAGGSAQASSTTGSSATGSSAQATVSQAGGPQNPNAAPASAIAAPRGVNPFTWAPGYRSPGSEANLALGRAKGAEPVERALISKIAAQPQGEWFGGWDADIRVAVDEAVSQAERQGQVPLLVAYNVPNRDCGQYSKGGAADPAGYKTWINAYAAAIGNRPAIVVLEPDALPQVAECLSLPDQEQRFELVRYALDTLLALPKTAVYLDAGHSNWVPAEVMAERLKRAGIERARGFSLNVSNYERDQNLIAYAHRVIDKLGVPTHFILDSSRNGNGPATGNEPWCNPAGRALGRAPSTQTGDEALDAFVWIKCPGESDGECKGGPAAGSWFAERALEMARNATW